QRNWSWWHLTSIAGWPSGPVTVCPVAQPARPATNVTNRKARITPASYSSSGTRLRIRGRTPDDPLSVTGLRREFARNNLLAVLAIAGVLPAIACGNVSSAAPGTGGAGGGAGGVSGAAGAS